MSPGPLAAARRSLAALRRRASTVRPLAVARARLEAELQGLQLSFTQGGLVAVVSDGQRQVWAPASRFTAVWEAIRYFEYLFETVRPATVDGTPVIDVSRPNEHVLARSGLSFRFTSMPESEAMNDLYLQAARLAPGDIAIDGGAYCGGSTWGLSVAVGAQGRVVALEPDPDNFAALALNVERHCLPNVTLLQEGLWSESGELEFLGGQGMVSAIVAPGQPAEGPTTRIRVRSVEGLINDLRLSRLDFLKLDIEGAELAVLESCRQVLRTLKPRLVVEAVEEDGALTTPRILRFLKSEGYRCQVAMEWWSAPFQVVCATPVS